MKILSATIDIELKNCPSGLGSVDQTKSLSDGGLRFRERRGRVKGLDSKARKMRVGFALGFLLVGLLVHELEGRIWGARGRGRGRR